MADRVLVGIPSYSHFGYVRRSAVTAKETAPSVDVLIADDASPDWDRVNWKDGWPKGLIRLRTNKNRGLTWNWNRILAEARDRGYDVVVLSNSDVIFTPGWLEGTLHGLEHVDLLGPVTNAPGHRRHQDVANHFPHYRITDDRNYLRSVASYLGRSWKHRAPVRVSHVNGFWMAARTDTWWSGAFDDQNVFDPRRKMVRNEDELQGRWGKMDRKIGYYPRVFIFHYRGVSRPGGTRGGQAKGWYRP